MNIYDYYWFNSNLQVIVLYCENQHIDFIV